MVKTYENLELFGPDSHRVLSILESRKNNQAVVCSISGGLQSRSTPKRIACAVKQAVVKRGLRKSSSLTNGISPVRNKIALKEYGTEARGLNLSCDNVDALILGNSGEQLTIAERRRH
jgi:hypothetical protein